MAIYNKTNHVLITTFIAFEQVLKFNKETVNVFSYTPHILNTERSYKRQGHATLKHFVGFFVQWWKAEITVA